MTILLDTSILIDHSRGLPAARDALTQLAVGNDFHSSEIVRAEFLVLIRERELEALNPLLGVITWHPVDRPVAELAGSLGRRWLPSHNGIDTADFLIAATATLIGAQLMTKNVKHFPMFAGLQPPY